MLARLLTGKDPLPHPPPKAFSSPWYTLMDSGRDFAYDVWEPPPYFKMPDALMIDQGTWQIAERLSDGAYLVTYREGGERYIVRRNPQPQNPGHRWLVIREDLVPPEGELPHGSA